MDDYKYHPKVADPTAAHQLPEGMVARAHAFIERKLASEPTELVYAQYVEACKGPFLSRVRAAREQRRAILPKLFVDSRKAAPKAWLCVRSIAEAMQLMRSQAVGELSISANAVCVETNAYRDFLHWVIADGSDRCGRAPAISVHSATARTRDRAKSLIEGLTPH